MNDQTARRKQSSCFPTWGKGEGPASPNSAPDIIRESRGALLHSVSPPFLGGKPVPASLCCSVGAVGAAAIGTLMQMSAGGKQRGSLAEPELPTLHVEGGW